MRPVEVAANVPVPPEAAFAWWTDYRTTDHDGPVFRPVWRRRAILERDDAGRVVRFRDEGRVLGRDVSYESRLAYDPPRAVRERSDGPVGAFQAEYRFEPAQNGARVVFRTSGEIRPRWARALARVPGLVGALARWDLEGHVRELRRDARAGPTEGRTRR